METGAYTALIDDSTKTATTYSVSVLMKEAFTVYMASQVIYGTWIMKAGQDSADNDIARN